jgi:hypothetical protein
MRSFIVVFALLMCVTACNQKYVERELITVDPNTVTGTEAMFTCDQNSMNNMHSYAVAYAVEDAWAQCFSCIDNVQTTILLEKEGCGVQYTYTGYPLNLCRTMAPYGIYINIQLPDSCYHDVPVSSSTP